MFDLCSEEDVKKRINEKLGSYEWWTFVLANDSENIGTIEAIEKRFYTGDRNLGFEIVVAPNMLSFIFAKKEFMDAQQLADFMNELQASVDDVQAVTAEQLSKHDCVFLGKQGEEQKFRELAARLDLWRTSRTAKG